MRWQLAIFETTLVTAAGRSKSSIIGSVKCSYALISCHAVGVSQKFCTMNFKDPDDKLTTKTQNNIS